VRATLQALFIDSNELTVIARERLVCLTALSLFSASGSHIPAFPDFSGMSSLTQIFINSKVSVIPADHVRGLSNLKTLILQTNPLTALPDLSELTSLTHLQVDNNNFSSLTDLGNLSRLSVLYLHRNSFTELPDLCKYGFHLMQLIISFNPISSLNQSRINCLTQLQYFDFSFVDVTDVSDLSLDSVRTSLLGLAMQHNAIQTLPKWPNLTSLKEFNIIGCTNLQLPFDYFSDVNWGSLTILHMQNIGNTVLPDFSQLGLSLQTLNIALSKALSANVSGFARLSSLTVLQAQQVLFPFLPTTCPVVPSSLSVNVTGSFGLDLCDPRNAWLKMLQEHGASVHFTDQTCMPDSRLWSTLSTQDLIHAHLSTEKVKGKSRKITLTSDDFYVECGC